MSDSAIAIDVFGSDKAVLATDVSAGMHALKVTTSAPSDGIAIDGFGAAKYVIGTVKSGGVHTLCVTTGAANAAIALAGAAGEKVVLATAASGGVHALAVTTAAANAGVLINGFGAGLVPIATVLAGGVHTLAVSDTANGGFAVNCFGGDRRVMAAALTGGTYSLTVSGLAPAIDPEAAAYFTTAGIIDDAAKAAINTFFVGVKADLGGIATLSQRFDRLWITCNTSAAAVVIDLCGGASATLVNSPTFTKWRGLQANNSGYFRTNFNESTDGVRYLNNAHSFFVYLRSGNTVGTGVSNATLVWRSAAPFAIRGWNPQNGSGIGTFYEYGVQAAYTFNGTWKGLRFGNRAATNVCKLWQDGSVIASGTVAPDQAINANWPFLGANVDGTITGTTDPDNMGICGFGSSFSDAEIVAFNSRVNTLMDTLYTL